MYVVRVFGRRSREQTYLPELKEVAPSVANAIDPYQLPDVTISSVFSDSKNNALYSTVHTLLYKYWRWRKRTDWEAFNI